MLRFRRKADDLAKSKEMKTGCNLSQFSKQSSAPKKGSFVDNYDDEYI
jgi:hypothetical protein